MPGHNVTQVSARDINITTRGATSTLATSQLALVDGRSIYLDFFGMVMWDLVPANPHEIKQIEVIRGPASAVWGANAMTGVVNVITKTPRELAAAGGTSLTIGAGGFDRNVDRTSTRTRARCSTSTARTPQAVERPLVPTSCRRATSPRTRCRGRPARSRTRSTRRIRRYANTGTSQPKFDARVDYDVDDGGTVSASAAASPAPKGIIHTGIGPVRHRQRTRA